MVVLRVIVCWTLQVVNRANSLSPVILQAQAELLHFRSSDQAQLCPAEENMLLDQLLELIEQVSIDCFGFHESE